MIQNPSVTAGTLISVARSDSVIVSCPLVLAVAFGEIFLTLHFGKP
jgi:hypothetical protein